MSSHALHAGRNGATIAAVPTGHHGFPYTTEAIESLFHYQKEVTKPCIYKEETSEWPASGLTPEALKELYGTMPVNKSDILFHLKKTAPTLPEILPLSTIIEMTEEGKDIQGIIINADAGAYSSLLLLSDIEKYFPLPGRAEKESYPSRLPTRLMALHITNKHFASGLSQTPYSTSQLIIQTHGQQKVMLMSPDHVQNLPALFNKEGKFDCSQVDLSASEAHLRNERRLANTTFYSAVLSPGDILLVPANWLIHQQALSTSIWATFTCFSDDKFPLTSQTKFRREKPECMLAELPAVQWATFSDKCSEILLISGIERLKLAEQAVSQREREEVHRHPENHDNIWRADEITKTGLYNAAYRSDFNPDQISRLELKDLQLSPLPPHPITPQIMQMQHISHLNLGGNCLTRFSISDMKHLEHLESLNLSGNKLTEFSVYNAKNLQLLHLKNNELATFSSSNLPKISCIDLRHNKMITLEEGCIRDMNAKDFLWLDLQDNPLSEEAIQQIKLDAMLSRKFPFVFLDRAHDDTLVQIEARRIADRVTRWAKKEARMHPENLANIRHAAEIIKISLYNVAYRPDLDPDQISHLELKDLQLSSLPPEVVQLKYIKHLDLGGNWLTKLSITDMENMESLDLSGNRLTEFFTRNMKNLKKLNLANNRLTVFWGSKLPCIEFINLEDNKLVALEEDFIVNLGTGNPLQVELKGNPLSAKGVMQLNVMLRSERNIINYPLDENCLTDEQLSMQLKQVRAVITWAKGEADRHPENHANICLAAAIIKNSMYNAMYQPFYVIPEDIPHLSLENLNLTSFPPEIMQMKHITSLHLCGNSFTECSISGMENLKRLYLCHNNIPGFSFSVSNMEKLNTLSLSDNQLTDFSIKDVKNLKWLHLENNKLTTFSSRNLPGLQGVNLAHNKLVALEEGSIRSMNQDELFCLDLRDNPLSNEAVQQIQLDVMSRAGTSRIFYPHGAQLLTKGQLLIKAIADRALPFKSFEMLLEEKEIVPDPVDLRCPVSYDRPENVIFLKQGANVYKSFDAEALIDWIKNFLSKSMSPENPLTRSPIKLQHILSPFECPLEKVYGKPAISH